jgi:ATP-binding cassette subfamily B protein
MSRGTADIQRPISSQGPGGLMRGGSSVQRAKNPRVALVRLARYLLPFKWRLVLIFSLVILSGILSLLGPYLLGIAIDRYILTGDLQQVFRIFFGIGFETTAPANAMAVGVMNKSATTTKSSFLKAS